MSPAESINSITVGSAHADSSGKFNSHDAFNPFVSLLPSPISPFGSGYRNSIKPDLIFPGGKQLYRQSIGAKSGTIDPVMTHSSPGNMVAYPGTQAGALNNTIYCRGTSNSAVLLSRSAAICHDLLWEILPNNALDINYDSYSTPLLKAMLVHGCSWSDIGQAIKNIIQDQTLTSHQIKKSVSKWLGYGLPDINRVLDCTEQRASIIGFGSLKNGDAHVFELPLPPSLESKIEWRKVTVTLAWLSPIVANNQKYRQASLWFELPDNNFATSRSDAQWQAVKRGTIQHESFEGGNAVSFPDDNILKIKVNCTEDAGKIDQPVLYGLMVSLEVREGTGIPIYQEIRNKIAPLVKIEQTP